MQIKERRLVKKQFLCYSLFYQDWNDTMGKIKSALEIALERTESVKGDRESIGQFEAKQKGKKLANRFLGGEVKSLSDEIAREKKDGQVSLKQGLFDVLISQISLPASKEELERIEISCQGLQTIIGGKQFGDISKQLVKILNQFLEEASMFEETIKRQYGPKLRHKEEELSRRFGRNVKLDPFQDPEFVTFFNQNMNALRANYQAAIDKTREEAQRLFDPEK